jgi:anti-sigma regulatory factor (Ser/Thr protein kinase)
MNVVAKRISEGATPAAGTTVTLRFSSVQEFIPGICQACAAFVAAPPAAEVPELTLVLRELLSNAIEHGNRHDPAKQVTCQLALVGPQCVEVTIADEGSGFDPDTVTLQWPDQPSETGAGGLRLVNALSDGLHFERGGRSVVCRVSWNAVSSADANRQQLAGSGKKEN